MEALIRDYQVHGILEMAQEDPGVIRDIQRLLYSVDKEMRWKAADLLGQASAFIAGRDPEPVARLLQGLFTSLKDTAASSWGALDAIGEIIRNEPEVFAGHCPLLYSFVQDRVLLPEVLRALARISEKCPDLVTKQAFQFIPLLEDHDPDIRGYTALFLGNVGLSQAKTALEGLVDDSTAIDLYHDGAIEKRTVGHIARLASEKL